MQKRILGLLAASLMSACLLVDPAAAEPYPGTVATVSKADGPQRVEQGHKPRTKVQVKAAGNAKPVGKLVVRYERNQGGFQASRTVKYAGKPVTFRGPKLTKRGRYTVSVRYVPREDSVFKKSSDSYTFKVVR